MPQNTVCVTRGTLWGNPYVVGQYAFAGVVPGQVRCNGDAVDCFISAVYDFKRAWPVQFEQWIAPLRGKNLACFCSLDEPCHADHLLVLAAGAPFEICHFCGLNYAKDCRGSSCEHKLKAKTNQRRAE
jgi:hypothetical protein